MLYHPHFPLLGCAIGDALGKPFETKPRGHTDLVSWDQDSFLPGDYANLVGPYQSDDPLLNQPGVPTDDTQMSRIVAAEIFHSGVRQTNLTQSYVEWLQGRSFVGRPRGMGGTVRSSLIARSLGMTPTPLDPTKRCGSGTAMRAGLWGMHPKGLDHALELAVADAQITHPGHPDAVDASVAMTLAVHHARTVSAPGGPMWDLIPYVRNRARRPEGSLAWALRYAELLCLREMKGMKFEEENPFPDDAVGLTAEVLIIAQLAHSYEEGVVRAIRLGGDTDTRAAMVGTILGTLHGCSSEENINGTGIPHRWVSKLLSEPNSGGHDNMQAIYQEDVALCQALYGSWA